MYRLVLIDDETKILDGLANLFPWQQIGFEVAGVFDDARKAWQFIQESPVDVVVSDISMPHMTGFELAEKLAPLGRVRLVFISSYTNYEYFRGAIKHRVEDYLIKPIKHDQLMECMEAIRVGLDQEYGKDKDGGGAYYEQIVQIVQAYLREHYRDATLAQAAQRANLSASYLSKVYKEKAGVSFSESLLAIRMEKACELLSDIHKKSYEIAYDVGYDNPKNFSRAFKGYFQISPMEYRNAKRNQP